MFQKGWRGIHRNSTCITSCRPQNELEEGGLNASLGYKVSWFFEQQTERRCPIFETTPEYLHKLRVFMDCAFVETLKFEVKLPEPPHCTPRESVEHRLVPSAGVLGKLRCPPACPPGQGAFHYLLYPAKYGGTL
ncbi:hypothetical protein PTI98_003631 [Pleurotus ostreatus]|nr:hypothetical protein PTI98_003631 [Pleurotus ostreatus]